MAINQYATEIKHYAVTAVCLPTGDIKFYFHPRDTNKLDQLLKTRDLAWYTAGGEVANPMMLKPAAIKGLNEEMDIEQVPLYTRFNEGTSPRQKSERRRRKREEDVYSQTEY